MAKYHVKENGEPGVCKAEQGKCPLGADNPHFKTKQEARQHYEQEQTLEFSINKKITPVDTLFSTEELSRMIDEGYVSCNSHPDDESLKVLCYGNSTQREGKWNDVTKNCRGLVIRSNEEDFSDAVIVERSWKKFYTLSQIESGWALGDEENTSSARTELDLIDFDAPAEVTNKEDGSMAILYTAPDGELALTTKGSFTSDQAKYYTNMMRKNKEYLETMRELKKNNPDTTFIFEVVGKENRIVLKYDDDDIVFLGAVDKHSGKYRSTDDFKEWEENGLNKAEKMNAKNLQEALSLPDRDSKEGVVVLIKSEDPEKQMQIKIKQEDYLKLHHLMTDFGAGKKREILFKNDIKLDEFENAYRDKNVTRIKCINEQFDLVGNDEQMREAIEDVMIKDYENSIFSEMERYHKAKNFVDSLKKESFSGDTQEAIKNFALSVKNRKDKDIDQAYLFQLFRQKLLGKDNSSNISNIIKKNASRLIKD